MPSRCMEYMYSGSDGADIIIRTELFRKDVWQMLSEDDYVYMESGAWFYFELLKHNGLMLHASAVEMDGKAYLFSGNSGVGKSTHTNLWLAEFEGRAEILNDDKPALRFIDGKWYAYGTPWSGKHGINQNRRLPLAGICFLKQSKENKIRSLNNAEAITRLVKQTLRRFNRTESLNLMLSHLDMLVRNVPVFELENRPEPEAARLSYETMRRAAEEMRL